MPIENTNWYKNVENVILSEMILKIAGVDESPEIIEVDKETDEEYEYDIKHESRQD